MLAAIGVRSIADLFADIPERVRFPHLNLSPPLSEQEVRQELETLADFNYTTGDGPSFLGAGAYNHFVPAVVDAVLRRGEFYTAYTPYQPEISQGTLQAIFEYQSMICALTGMEAANASHYDGATATAEAVITAINVHRLKRRKVVVSPYVHPEYRMRVPKDFEMTDEERALGLTPEQAAFRRFKIKEIGLRAFRELYPEDDISCFIFSGSPFFNPETLRHYLESPRLAKDFPCLRGDVFAEYPGQGAVLGDRERTADDLPAA